MNILGKCSHSQCLYLLDGIPHSRWFTESVTLAESGTSPSQPVARLQSDEERLQCSSVSTQVNSLITVLGIFIQTGVCLIKLASSACIRFFNILILSFIFCFKILIFCIIQICYA